MSAFGQIALAWGAMALLMALLWEFQRRRGAAGIVDVAWSFGTGLVAVAFAIGGEGFGARRTIVAILAAVWAVRLGAYLAKRLAREKEDGRYAMLAEKWGDKTQRNLFVFFQIQALWAVMFAMPMFAAAGNPSAPLTWTDFAGIVVFLTGVIGESIADRQLERFRSDSANAGRVCREGLWAWSRHPNYFFEWVHWWAWVLLAAGGPLPNLAVAVAGAVLMYLFITKLTGIPPVEKRALVTRGDAYREYQRTTSAFFPRRPRTKSEEAKTCSDAR